MAAAQAPGVPILEFTFNYGITAASSSGPGPQGSFQYCAVKPTANDLEVAPSSSGGVTIVANTQAYGILQNQPGVSGAAAVRMLGISKHVVDGSGTAITPGKWLTSDAAGRGIVATSTSQNTYAYALQSSAAQNDIISVFISALPPGAN
jgi:hypothetical protein